MKSPLRVLQLEDNANDAAIVQSTLRKGGRLTIATRNVKPGDSDFSTCQETVPGLPADATLELEEAGYVMLSVSDTGTGMTDEVKQRLFDPFFTTKPPGKGTGLGLTTCQTIVQQLGGRIELHSVLESGVAFLPKPYTPAMLARTVRSILDNELDTAFFRKLSQTNRHGSGG